MGRSPTGRYARERKERRPSRSRSRSRSRRSRDRPGERRRSRSGDRERGKEKGGEIFGRGRANSRHAHVPPRMRRSSSRDRHADKERRRSRSRSKDCRSRDRQDERVRSRSRDRDRREGAGAGEEEEGLLRALNSHKEGIKDSEARTRELEEDAGGWGEPSPDLRHSAEVIEVKRADLLYNWCVCAACRVRVHRLFSFLLRICCSAMFYRATGFCFRAGPTDRDWLLFSSRSD
jgi:hypothetical protein